MDDIKSGSAIDATHYQHGEKQPIEIMQDMLPKEQFIGFLRCNVLKYTLRLGYKGDSLKDAQKGAQYAKWLCDALEGKKIKPMGEKPTIGVPKKEENELLINKFAPQFIKREYKNCNTCANNMDNEHCTISTFSAKDKKCSASNNYEQWEPK